MVKSSEPNPDRSEKTTIDHLIDRVFDPKGQESHEQPATTESGASVEEQVRKEWDPKQSGGLPTF